MRCTRESNWEGSIPLVPPYYTEHKDLITHQKTWIVNFCSLLYNRQVAHMIRANLFFLLLLGFFLSKTTKLKMSWPKLLKDFCTKRSTICIQTPINKVVKFWFTSRLVSKMFTLYNTILFASWIESEIGNFNGCQWDYCSSSAPKLWLMCPSLTTLSG